MIGVLDTGGANLTSLFAAIERLGKTPELVTGPMALRRASHVLLPGVGAAGEAMRRLRDSGLAAQVSRLAVPVLGICLGMQLMYEASAEDEAECLGLLPGRVSALRPQPGLPVPHMGWSRLHWRRPSMLRQDISSDAYFYFVHSFAVTDTAPAVAAATHGENFSAIIEQGNFFGTQFHPERSGQAGSRLLENFLRLS